MQCLLNYKVSIELGSFQFKANYEKDMLGNILEQIKSEISKKENHLYSCDKKILNNIVKKLETDGLIDKLNICSHDNVKHKITQGIIENIHSDIEILIKYSYKFFKLNI